MLWDGNLLYGDIGRYYDNVWIRLVWVWVPGWSSGLCSINPTVSKDDMGKGRYV